MKQIRSFQQLLTQLVALPGWRCAQHLASHSYQPLLCRDILTFFAHIITSQRKLHFQPMSKECINRRLIEDFCMVQQDDYKLDFLSVIFQVWEKKSWIE